MESVKEGPPLIINRTILMQLMEDPVFFQNVPVFYHMKDQAAAVVKRLKNARKPCGNCVRPLLQPLQQQFVRLIHGLNQDNPAALAPLVTYLTTRRGYRPTPIVVYHKVDGKPLAINL